MKFIAVVLTALLASVAASSPEADRRTNERFVDGIVAEMIENLSRDIQEMGLDPLYVSESTYVRLPVTDLLVLKAEIIELLSTGLSNIVLNRVNYSILTSRLTFEISLPLIATRIVSSNMDLTFFGYQADASVRGSLDVLDIRVSGDIRLSIGIISGISVRSISIDFRLGGIRSKPPGLSVRCGLTLMDALTVNGVMPALSTNSVHKSDLEVIVLGKDLSDKVNKMAGETVPIVLAENRDDINRVLEHYVKEAIESNL